jgi:glycosyltransferase involved in cell wall biosynthesis
MPHTIVVVPCFNESARISGGEFIRHVQQQPGHGFLFVDDGSTDDTYALLQKACGECPSALQCLQLPKNRGKAEAVRIGLLSALAQQPEYVGYWDADLATPLAAISDFLDVFRRHAERQLVMGARVRLLGRQITRNPLRHYLGRAYATAADQLLGIGVYDTQCGAKLFRASEELASIFAQPFRVTWTFDVEMLLRFITQICNSDLPAAQARIYEYPLHCWTDVPGSKVRPLDFFKAMLELATLGWHYSWKGRGSSYAQRTSAAAPVGRPLTGGKRRGSEER